MVHDPTMKCSYKLPGGMNCDNKISILGTIPADAQRFSIDFERCEGSVRIDVVFHLNPRFDQMVVVRNSLIAGNWGEEQKSGAMPLSRGEIFDLLITCDEQSWKVAFNGQHFCEFPHRALYQRITHMSVYGDVNVKQVSL